MKYSLFKYSYWIIDFIVFNVMCCMSIATTKWNYARSNKSGVRAVPASRRITAAGIESGEACNIHYLNIHII